MKHPPPAHVLLFVRGQPTEVIFIDNSSDDAPAAIERAAMDYPSPVLLIHRTGGQRTGGLGGAVASGMRAASGHWLVVMDGDVRHPPN